MEAVDQPIMPGGGEGAGHGVTLLQGFSFSSPRVGALGSLQVPPAVGGGDGEVRTILKKRGELGCLRRAW